METTNDPGSAADRIVLPAELSAMDRVPPWIEHRVREHNIDERMHFAVRLCLEEAVSNIIRHGSVGEHAVSAVAITCYRLQSGDLIFTVEDDGPHFNPLTVPPSPLVDEEGEIPVGGRGLRLLRGFADSLAYEATPSGNRLTIGFHIDNR